MGQDNYPMIRIDDQLKVRLMNTNQVNLLRVYNKQSIFNTLNIVHELKNEGNE